MNLDKSNFMSLLFDAEPVGCVRDAAAEAPVTPPLVAASALPPAGCVREVAAEAPVAPPLVATSAPPPARLVLRAARGVSRAVREKGSRPEPKPKPAPPGREEEPSEPAGKGRCGRWLTRDGCRKRSSQFGGLVPITRDQSLDPPPYACFNCLRQGHTMKRCPEPWRGTVCYNCGRRGMTMSTCDRCGLAHRAYLASKKEERLARSGAGASTAASSAAVPPPRPMEVAEEKKGPKRKTRRSKRKVKKPSEQTDPTPSGTAVETAPTSSAATSEPGPNPSGSAQEFGISSGTRQAVIDELLGGLPAPLRDEVHQAWRAMGLCSSVPLAELQPGEEPD